MKKKSNFIPLIIYLVALVLLFSWMTGIFESRSEGLTYSQIQELFYQEQVKSFTVEGQKIHLQLHNPYQGKTSLTCSLADSESFRAEMGELLRTQAESGVLESYDFRPSSPVTPYDFVLPLLIVGLVLLLVHLQMV